MTIWGINFLCEGGTNRYLSGKWSNSWVLQNVKDTSRKLHINFQIVTFMESGS
jgi:hypothetical protein